MAERRPPGFNVPLGFYDGPEVESIPRRIRAAAVGVWTLCGTFSANKLQDGYVGPEMLKQLGCTDAIRAALKATKGPDGEPDPLWIDARDGGVQFTKWVKYQRSRAEVKAYRDADAERKRRERNGNKPASTSKNGETSDRTSAGHPPDHRDPKTETETKTEELTHVYDESSLNVGDPSAEQTDLSKPVTQSASRLVHQIIGSAAHGYSAAVLTKLRINASQLVAEVGPEVTAEALRVWKTKSNLGPDALSALTAEAVKTLNPTPAKPHKLRQLAELANELRADEQVVGTVATRRELER